MTIDDRKLFCLLCLALLVAGGCVSNRDVARNGNADAMPSADRAAKSTETAQPTVSTAAPEASKTPAKTTVAPAETVSPSLADSDFAHLKSEHAAALKTWLAQNKQWQPAQERDYDQESLKYAKADKSRKNYHPYYAFGDFNRDGREDFGVGLVDAKTRRKLAFAVFNAPFAAGKTAFFTDRTERDDIIFYDDAEADKYLFIGTDYSDNGYTLEPKGDQYAVKMMFEDEP